MPSTVSVGRFATMNAPERQNLAALPPGWPSGAGRDQPLHWIPVLHTGPTPNRATDSAATRSAHACRRRSCGAGRHQPTRAGHADCRPHRSPRDRTSQDAVRRRIVARLARRCTRAAPGRMPRRSAPAARRWNTSPRSLGWSVPVCRVATCPGRTPRSIGAKPKSVCSARIPVCR